jgi:hypothetical protein
MQISALKEKAKLGKNPEFWAEYIITNEEEPGCKALLYVIDNGATFEHLLTFDPEIAQNPQLTFWFRKVYDGLRSDDGNVDTAGKGGDAGNPKPDGNASPPRQSGAVYPVAVPDVS